MNFKGKNIISMHDLSKQEIIHILKTAECMEKKKYYDLLKGKILATLFFEPSTRTKLSFHSAMKQLGGSTIGFSDAQTSSTTKGESLHDTIRMVEQYCDAIVMRHPLDGSARLAAEIASVPVINGGDGKNQHPTQTLLDLYTIKKTQGKISKLHVAILGDLKYGRTAHSLATALSLFDCKLSFISPPSLRMPRQICDELTEKNIHFTEHESVEKIIPDIDILYSTRIQRERFPDPREYEMVKNAFILDTPLFKNAKPTLKLLHPLPRVNEITTNMDATPYASYFEQAGNGIPIRKAVLALVLGAKL
ncbi:aspartate carbamoyltransferase [Candidatus Woesearchaeota archaeon]|nr:aspartate carbamoyltransferase [Candidatus Woesearchaeota archaeon]